MSLLGVASKMGVTTSALEELIGGSVSIGVASKVGALTSSVQAFIDGEATIGMASALGCMTSAAQEIRDEIGREGAIGLIIGLCIAKRRSG